MIETINTEPLKAKLKSRCRTGDADIDGKGIPTPANGADTHKKNSRKVEERAERRRRSRPEEPRVVDAEKFTD